MIWPKVSIIIVNWNNWKDTLECLKSLKELDYPNFRIVIVDNGSQDDSKKKIKNYLRKVSCPEKYVFISSQFNLGFSGGNNLGIKAGLTHHSDYFLLLNNDTVVEKKFLKELVKVGESKKQIGVLGPLIYFYDNPKKIWFAGGRFNWLKLSWVKGRGHLGYDIPISDKFLKRPQKVDFITGCALLIKKEVVEKIGLMDEDYFLYYEDVDWCLKAGKAGYNCVFVPSAKIWHKISSSASKLAQPIIFRYHYRNALKLVKKNAPFWVKFFIPFWSGGVILKQIIKYLFFPQKREIALAISQGIFDFYKGRKGKIA